VGPEKEDDVKSKQIHEAGGERIYALVLDKGDEVVQEITGFARDNALDAASFTAIGAFSEATLGYFDVDKKEYEQIPVHEQVEVLSLVGDIALNEGEPELHAHVVLGRRDGTTRGGHLLEARVHPTLEVVLTESPEHLRKETDPETGLALISIEDRG
jgi:predicted DNA-binding protein with PD1-like motif